MDISQPSQSNQERAKNFIKNNIPLLCEGGEPDFGLINNDKTGDNTLSLIYKMMQVTDSKEVEYLLELSNLANVVIDNGGIPSNQEGKGTDISVQNTLNHILIAIAIHKNSPEIVEVLCNSLARLINEKDAFGSRNNDQINPESKTIIFRNTANLCLRVIFDLSNNSDAVLKLSELLAKMIISYQAVPALDCENVETAEKIFCLNTKVILSGVYKKYEEDEKVEKILKPIVDRLAIAKVKSGPIPDLLSYDFGLSNAELDIFKKSVENSLSRTSSSSSVTSDENAISAAQTSRPTIIIDIPLIPAHPPRLPSIKDRNLLQPEAPRNFRSLEDSGAESFNHPYVVSEIAESVEDKQSSDDPGLRPGPTPENFVAKKSKDSICSKCVIL